MRHPSKVGAFCARKLKRLGVSINCLGHGGPPKPKTMRKALRPGKPQMFRSCDQKPEFGLRLLARARRDALRHARKLAGRAQ